MQRQKEIRGTGASDSARLSYPFTYTLVKPERAAEVAYRGYYSAGCAYGAFAGVIKAVLEVGSDAALAAFPLALSAYGKGGLAGNRSLCGAVNGGSMAIAMFHGSADAEAETSKTRDRLINQLTGWIQETELPGFEPSEELSGQTGGMAGAIEATVAGTLICDESCTVWQERTGHDRDSRQRRERCARLTADVAAKVAELLNATSRQ
jgi:hypothetical protein